MGDLKLSYGGGKPQIGGEGGGAISWLKKLIPLDTMNRNMYHL